MRARYGRYLKERQPRMSDQVRSMRAHQLAHLLLSIRDDLLHVSSLSKEKSWALQEYAATRFMIFMKLPTIDIHNIHRLCLALAMEKVR